MHPVTYFNEMKLKPLASEDDSAHAVVSAFATQMPAYDDMVAMRVGYTTLVRLIIIKHF